MIKAVRVSAIAVLGAFLLTGAALATDPPPAPPPPAQDEAAPPPPPAPPAPPAAPSAQAAEKDSLDEIVCRKEEATVGSRIGARKVCKTRRQWRDEQRDATSRGLPDGSYVPPTAGGAS